VVDGSNIATEGRSQPSLEQLNDAVLAFMDDHPDAVITVVVDATFGHRIDGKEVKAFDEAVANNELVTPPAGAIGRGDAFVLTIANKAGAGVLSNDSFQEFHGDYDWLFDEGRLIGGKPVPHVGWVFVARTPVRGPKSRQSVREAKNDAKGAVRTDAKERANSRVRPKAAAQPAEDGDEQSPTTEAAPAGARSGRSRGGRGRGSKSVEAPPAEQQVAEVARAAPPSRGHINDLMPFLEFVERHPVGTSCTGVVESYASHGAYARVDDVLIYIPLRLMDSPAPRSARSVLAAGEAVTAVIVGYVPDRRSIDAALPHMATAAMADAAPGGSDAGTAESGPVSEPQKAPAKKAAARKAPAKKAPAKKASARKAPARKAPAKKAAAKKAPAEKSAAEVQAVVPPAAISKQPARPVAQAAAKKAPSTRRGAASKPAAKAPPKKAAATKAPAKKAPARKAPAKKAPATKAPAKKAPARKAPARKAPAKNAPATKAPAKKAPAKKAGA